MLPLKIAIRFLCSGKTQTILIVVGIAVAISIQIFVGLLIDSLQISLLDSTIGRSPQIIITSATDTETIRDWRTIVTKVKGLSSTRVVTPVASANAFVKTEEKELPVVIKGFDLTDADRIYKISGAVYRGALFSSAREVLIGKELNAEMGLTPGDRIGILLPDGSEFIFTVAGFYDLGAASINKTWIIADLKSVQQLFKLNGRVNAIEIATPDVFSADTVADEIRTYLNDPAIKIENWKELNAELLSGLEGQRVSSIMIQAVIILSVVIAIASVLAISVLQKSRQIGILKAMGIKDSAASMIFIYEGFLIGIIGSIAGIALGLGLLYSFNIFATRPDGTKLFDLYIENGFIIRSWIIALLASTFAGIIPARRSLRLNPVDVIREG